MGESKPALDALKLPLAQLEGIGTERASHLGRLDLHTVGDLLLHRPRRYEDRRRICKISELKTGEALTAHGTVVAAGVKRWKHGTKSVFELVLDDGTSRLHCRWWNLPYMESYFAVGDELLVFGKVRSLKPRAIDHPETEVIEGGEEKSIHLNRIAPVYPLTEGLSQRWLRSLIWRALRRFEPDIAEPHPEIAPPGPARAKAVQMLHFPDEMSDAGIARARLALDEFVELQVAIQGRRNRLEAKARALPCGGDNRLIRKFLAAIEFSLTGAQKRVLREIRSDMSADAAGVKAPMRRLLQGDVGSGKTVVAACAALMALEGDYNVALMAPTEILAEQHYRNFRKWFTPLDVPAHLITGSRKTIEGRADRAGLGLSTRDPRRPALHIGTHALIEARFAPGRLGLVIIDEQHKFGVAQREKLVRKGNYPHLLVMTATPIPRTLGLTLYGDLDISVIDEMPAGRGRVRTYVRTPDRLPKVREFVRQKLREGRQAYVVYPRVEEADLKSGIKAVTRELANLQHELAPFRVGLLHGRLKSEEKDQVMAAFRANRIQVLLATSVIEVGVDVPNATVMLIESAELFGLAQLHQLRGRIGRGAHESYCILVASVKTDEARARLKVMEETSDGFRIAEADLQLRGAGELLGQAQSGLPPFKFGNLALDVTLIERARELVRECKMKKLRGP